MPLNGMALMSHMSKRILAHECPLSVKLAEPRDESNWTTYNDIVKHNILPLSPYIYTPYNALQATSLQQTYYITPSTTDSTS